MQIHSPTALKHIILTSLIVGFAYYIHLFKNKGKDNSVWSKVASAFWSKIVDLTTTIFVTQSS